MYFGTDCVPLDRVDLGQDVPKVLETGYNIPSNVVYILCSDFCQRYHASIVKRVVWYFEEGRVVL